MWYAEDAEIIKDGICGRVDKWVDWDKLIKRQIKYRTDNLHTIYIRFSLAENFLPKFGTPLDKYDS